MRILVTKEINKKETQGLTRVFSNPEGRILALGLITGVLFLGWSGLSYFWLPGKTHLLFAMAGTCITFGRAAGMYLGISTGLNHFLVIAINLLVDTTWVLFFYPLVILSMKNLMVVKILKKNIDRILSAAQSNQNRIKRYGVPGLFFFVLCPLPMTGPVVGGVIGYLMGLRPWVNMLVVLSATYTTIIIWALVLLAIHHKIQAYNSITPTAFFFTIVILVLTGRYMHKAIVNRHQLKEIDH